MTDQCPEEPFSQGTVKDHLKIHLCDCGTHSVLGSSSCTVRRVVLPAGTKIVKQLSIRGAASPAVDVVDVAVVVAVPEQPAQTFPPSQMGTGGSCMPMTSRYLLNRW